ncbi:DoxX family protein [Streptomyces sp. NPDC002536]
MAFSSNPLGAPLSGPPSSGGTDPLGCDVGLLFLRLVAGLTMAAHGTQKLFGWFDGPGLVLTGHEFTKIGYPAGKAMAVVAGLTETLGGLGVALGLLTPLAAAGLFGIMINALVVKDDGFFAPEGVEYEILLATAAVCLALAGPGRCAVDHFLPVLRRHRLWRGAAAIVLGGVLAGVFLLLRA